MSSLVRRSTRGRTDEELGKALRSHAPEASRAGGAGAVVARMLALQGTSGNRAVGEMLRSRGASSGASGRTLWKAAMRGVNPAISGTAGVGDGSALKEAGGGVAIGEAADTSGGAGLTSEEADAQIAAREGSSGASAPRTGADPGRSTEDDESTRGPTAQRRNLDGSGTPHDAPLPADPSRPTVRQGSRDLAVIELQTRLNAVGATLTPDGAFGALTRAAVVAFQSAHAPLTADGVAGPMTWGALAAHTPTPGPVVPPGPPIPPTPPRPPSGSLTITSRTDMRAPDGTSNARSTVAMGEVVFFSVGGSAVDWSASAGTPLVRRGRTEFAWERTTPGPATITATDPTTGQTATIDMTVVGPSSLRMVKTSEPAAAAAGADMIQSPRFGSRSVNFGNCEWLEVSNNTAAAGAPTGFTGTYFQTLIASGVNLNHVPTPNFLRIDQNLTDEAGIRGLPAPFSAGSFFWNIPNRFRRAATGGNGEVFVNSTQHFSISATGRVTVSKQGASVTKP